jgi:hypothetical protein
MTDNRDLDRVYLAIGKFQVNWSMFEYDLYLFTKIIYANCESKIIPAKFPDGIAGKIKLLNRVLKEEPRLSEIRSDGLKLIKSLWRHRDLRNLIVHGTISNIKNSSTLTFLVPPEIGAGPLKRAKRVRVELSQIEKEAQEMEIGAMDLGWFSGGFQEALPIPPGSHP